MAELKISPPPFPNREKYPFVATVRYRKMVIDIENLDGSTREGKDPNGKPWKTEFRGAHYGEIRDSKGTDGDPLDVYIKNPPDDGANKAYIVHQNHPRTHPTKAGQYDEDKVVLGVSSAEEAKALYLKHYNRKDFLRSITEMTIEPFKRYIFGENKAEKVARFITKSELRSYVTDPEKVKKAARNLVKKRPASAFIRMRLRGDLFEKGKEMKTKTAQGLVGMTYDPNNPLVQRMQQQWGADWKQRLAKMRGISPQNVQPKMAGSADYEGECETPGEKIRSKGKGRGEARGRGRGPLGVPFGTPATDEETVCETPGEKKRSRGMGRGLARGKGKGPIGVPVGKKKIATVRDAYEYGYELGMRSKLAQFGTAGMFMGPALSASMTRAMPTVQPNVQNRAATAQPGVAGSTGSAATPVSSTGTQMASQAVNQGQGAMPGMPKPTPVAQV
jgi:hypothetical protein